MGLTAKNKDESNQHGFFPCSYGLREGTQLSSRLHMGGISAETQGPLLDP